ncbi:DNA helicase [Brachybacterium ginsengisoli]|uniref:DNA helicase n=2 Tax=Brachybacterium ginsengisoli TaxID=1331682 RepID=A0A291H2G3_9MICO|nr:DNA helicase [Brachybacterium ginsengisoli]
MYAHLDGEQDRIAAAREAERASHVESIEAREAREATVARLGGALERLRSAERSLCFGRVDGTDGQSHRIGRIGLRSESGEILLVDWRAEAARPFYAATMATPMDLCRRRHLRIEDRQIVELSDEVLSGEALPARDVVGDDPLVSAVSGARTGRMREAAATLQHEQDEIVRSEHRGTMVVDGGPGTGKTIVALHRAAYVLYAFPTVAARGMLVVGPNRRFLDYISHVLPSLGENDVELSTTTALTGDAVTVADSEEMARWKGRRVFADLLAQRVDAHRPHGVPLRLTTAHGTTVLDPARVDAARRSALQGGAGHHRARALFLEHVVDDLVSELERQTSQEITDYEEELKGIGIDLDRMFAGGSASAGAEASADELDIDWELLREELLEDPGVERAVEKVWPVLRAEGLLRGLLGDPDALAGAGLPAEVIASFGSRAGERWSSADLPLLDEARALVDGLPEKVYGHVVVDEAQQLTEMEWRMLMRRCPSRSMTIVGDLAQAGPTTTLTTWDEALEPFVGARFEHHTLTINYRTTAEILEASGSVLAQIAPTQRLSRSIRHGDAPTALDVADADLESALVDLVARLTGDHPDEMIGVVVTPERAQQIALGMASEKVTVVPAPEARGLEFDTVILVDPDGIRDESSAGLRDLYVAQTRATKRLVTLTTAPVAVSSGRA